MADTDRRLLLLDGTDNVLIAVARVRAGETIQVEGAPVTVVTDIPLGHKIARSDISPGDKIMKYGAPIGSATAAIRRGEHAHVHNIRSDYTLTYHLENVRTEHERGA